MNIQDKSINEGQLKIGSKIELSGGYDMIPFTYSFQLRIKELVQLQILLKVKIKALQLLLNWVKKYQVKK